jgi:predicted nucleic acid-binding protein
LAGVLRVDERLLALDTNALSAWIRGDAQVEALLSTATPVLPAPVLAEAVHGWILAMRKAEQRRREDQIGTALDGLRHLHAVTKAMTVLPYDASAQGVFQSLSRSRGSAARADLRIAAICAAHGVPLLTRNVSDFNGLPGVALRSW